MTEAQIHEEISNLIRKEIGKPFFRAWLGCVNDRGAICYRPRVQLDRSILEYSGFRTAISTSRRMGEIVQALCDEGRRALGKPCNAVTLIIEGDGSVRCDYSFRDVVKTGWAPIFEQWDRDYLTGLKPAPVKGKPWES